MNQKINILREEPYRIFFPLGMLFAFSGIGHWLAYGMGWMKAYSGAVHAACQMQLYMSCFILGFLMTAIPRLSGTPVLTWGEWAFVLIAVLAEGTLMVYGKLIAGEIAFSVSILAFLLFFMKRLGMRSQNQKVAMPANFIWIPLAMLTALASGVILSLGYAGYLGGRWVFMGRLLADQGYVLMIVLGIGTFLGPRLLGHDEIIPANEKTQPELRAQRIKKERYLYACVYLLLMGSFFMEVFGQVRVAYFLRASITMGVLIKNRAWPYLPRSPRAYAWPLWISFGFLGVGYWAVALMPSMKKELLHLIFLGGYSLMVFAIATMVIFSHGGKPEALSKPVYSLRGLTASIILALILRISASLVPEFYFQMLSAASMIWLLSAGYWCVEVLPAVRLMSNDGGHHKRGAC